MKVYNWIFFKIVIKYYMIHSAVITSEVNNNPFPLNLYFYQDYCKFNKFLQ